MRTYEIDCPSELSHDLERTSYEISMYEAVVDRYLDRHALEPDMLESPTFLKYLHNLTEKNIEYQQLKNIVTDTVIGPFKDHECDWNLDFNTERITITVKCDCDIDLTGCDIKYAE